MTTLLPFENDGCTFFPDSLFGVDWSKCCDVHDQAFATGTTVGEFLRANWALFNCVADYNPFIAATMFVGVMTGGAAFYFLGPKRLKPKDTDK